VASRPPEPRQLTEAAPWAYLTPRHQFLVRLQHTSPEPWWWRFDGNLAICVAPPFDRDDLYLRDTPY
jgi:hypothetical protein